MHAGIDFPSRVLSLHTLVLTSFLNHSNGSCGADASCCAAGTHHPSPSGAAQVKVMNLTQVPDKRLLFKATVPLIFRCAYAGSVVGLCKGVRVLGEGEQKSSLSWKIITVTFLSCAAKRY